MVNLSNINIFFLSFIWRFAKKVVTLQPKFENYGCFGNVLILDSLEEANH